MRSTTSPSRLASSTPRPDGSPAPALILDETPPERRRRVLERFEEGQRVRDSYPRWLLEPPWPPAARLRLIDVLPKPDESPGAKPHIEAIVDRLSVVLLSWEIRRAGIPVKASWLWVHRALAVARQDPGARELTLRDPGSLEQVYSEGLELFRRLGAPLPSGRQPTTTS